MKFSQLKQLTKMLQPSFLNRTVPEAIDEYSFTPTSYLSHPFLQSVYNIVEPRIPVDFERETIYFEDGGNIALDWSPRVNFDDAPPVLFIMHGLTGGSQMNYIRVITKEAAKEGYQCVCMNSRGINTEMTSPVPFTALDHHELDAAINRVHVYFPRSPIYLIGASFGGNYLIRYLLKNEPANVKGLVAIAAPFDISKVVDDMEAVYQRFFVKRYIMETVEKHPMMKYWEDIGLVDMKEVKKSKNLREFHSRLTAKIVGLDSAEKLFETYKIDGQMISKLGVKTLLMVSKDDTIVSYGSMPHEDIRQNQNIKFVATEKGGHLCWYQGAKPERWYPKPVFSYLRSLREIS